MPETKRREHAAQKEFAQSALDGLSATITILDRVGNLLAVNHAWDQFAVNNPPVNQNLAVGANYLSVCDSVVGAEQDEARLVARGIRAVAAGEQDHFSMEYPCHSPTENRWFMVRVTPFHGTGNARVVIAHENITVRKEAEIALARAYSALSESESRLTEAQRVARMGSWEYDMRAGKTTWSREMFRLFDLEMDDCGPSFEAMTSLYHPDDQAMRFAALQKAVRDGEPYEYDIRIFRQSGDVRWVHLLGQGELDASGRVIRLYGTCKDIHERKTLEAEKQERTEQLNAKTTALRTVLESAPIILYTAGADGIVTLSEGVGLTALGLKPGQSVGRSVFEFTTNSESIENARRAFAGESISYQANVNGLWLQTELRPVFGADGSQAGIIGVSLDVTERVASEQRFRVLFERSSDAHLLFDEHGIIDCNNATIVMLRCTDKSQVLSLHPAALSPEYQPDGRHSLDTSVEMDALAHEHGFHRFEWTHRKMDGEEFPVEVTLTPVTLAERPVLLVVWHDLTERLRSEELVRQNAALLEVQKLELERANSELGRANKRLEMLATTDGLTGLVNHRAFYQRLAGEMGRAARHSTPLSLILLDVDQFKQYNDTYGHPAGDNVLKAVASVLKNCARKADIVARYGGEEFALILPETEIHGASAYAERVRAAIMQQTWSARAVTASFGVASLELGERGDTDLIARADEALYLSKTSGRNRVTCATHQAIPRHRGNDPALMSPKT